VRPTLSLESAFMRVVRDYVVGLKASSGR
ncbi:MAG: hypothetical protein QG572_984, partial [Pseudomonadota bacterium]|nr:hypothetical protein [Pseudomonadota bacterium]